MRGREGQGGVQGGTWQALGARRWGRSRHNDASHQREVRGQAQAQVASLGSCNLHRLQPQQGQVQQCRPALPRPPPLPPSRVMAQIVWRLRLQHHLGQRLQLLAAGLALGNQAHRFCDPAKWLSSSSHTWAAPPMALVRRRARGPGSETFVLPKDRFWAREERGARLGVSSSPTLSDDRCRGRHQDPSLAACWSLLGPASLRSSSDFACEAPRPLILAVGFTWRPALVWNDAMPVFEAAFRRRQVL
jgi:hypothetical protein